MDQLTKEIDAFIATDIRPTKDARWQGLVLTLLDEIRCGLKGDAYFLDGMARRHAKDV